MKFTPIILALTLCGSLIAQNERGFTFEFGGNRQRISSPSVQSFLKDPPQNQLYASNGMDFGFGLDLSVKYQLASYFEVGISGSIQRFYASGTPEFYKLDPFTFETIETATGYSKVQLSNFSYGINADFIFSELLFPDWDRSRLKLTTAAHRSHIFLQDVIFNPISFREFYHAKPFWCRVVFSHRIFLYV